MLLVQQPGVRQLAEQDDQQEPLQDVLLVRQHEQRGEQPQEQRQREQERQQGVKPLQVRTRLRAAQVLRQREQLKYEGSWYLLCPVSGGAPHRDPRTTEYRCFEVFVAKSPAKRRFVLEVHCLSRFEPTLHLPRSLYPLPTIYEPAAQKTEHKTRNEKARTLYPGFREEFSWRCDQNFCACAFATTSSRLEPLTVEDFAPVNFVSTKRGPEPKDSAVSAGGAVRRRFGASAGAGSATLLPRRAGAAASSCAGAAAGARLVLAGTPAPIAARAFWLAVAVSSPARLKRTCAARKAFFVASSIGGSFDLVGASAAGAASAAMRARLVGAATGTTGAAAGAAGGRGARR